MVISGTNRISGMVLKDPASHVITASKNLGPGPLVTIQTGAGQTYNGWIIGRDDTKNLALVKVVGATLPGISWGDSIALDTGSELLSAGYPLSSGSKLLTVPAQVGDLQQDLNTGLQFFRLDVPHRSGNTGGPAINRDGQALGIGMEPLFVQSLGISVTSNVVYLLSADSILEVLPLLRQGVVEMARPTPTPNPAYQPSFITFLGTITIGGQAPPVGTRLYARILGGASGDVWASTKGDQVKADGTYFLEITVPAADLYQGATVEFYIEGVKANETSKFFKGNFVFPDLTFP